MVFGVVVHVLCVWGHLVVVVHNGLIVCFVDESLHCGLMLCVGGKPVHCRMNLEIV